MARRRFLLGRRKSGLDRLTVHEFQYGDARVRVYEEWTMRPELAESPDVPTFVLVHGLGVSSRFFLPLAHQCPGEHEDIIRRAGLAIKRAEGRE